MDSPGVKAGFPPHLEVFRSVQAHLTGSWYIITQTVARWATPTRCIGCRFQLLGVVSVTLPSCFLLGLTEPSEWFLIPIYLVCLTLYLLCGKGRDSDGLSRHHRSVERQGLERGIRNGSTGNNG